MKDVIINHFFLLEPFRFVDLWYKIQVEKNNG